MHHLYRGEIIILTGLLSITVLTLMLTFIGEMLLFHLRKIRKRYCSHRTMKSVVIFRQISRIFPRLGYIGMKDGFYTDWFSIFIGVNSLIRHIFIPFVTNGAYLDIFYMRPTYNGVDSATLLSSIAEIGIENSRIAIRSSDIESTIGIMMINSDNRCLKVQRVGQYTIIHW